jgi:hypothetical protein
MITPKTTALPPLTVPLAPEEYSELSCQCNSRLKMPELPQKGKRLLQIKEDPLNTRPMILVTSPCS